MIQIIQTDVFQRWLDRQKDRRLQTAVAQRLVRLSDGLFGDSKYLREEVYELRITYGPGYRIYYSYDKGILVVLLCAGTKSTQKRDIEKAIRLQKEIRHGSETLGI